MPRRYYRRRFYKRRAARQKVPWYRKKYSALQLAAKAVSGVRYLKGLVNSEMLKRDKNGQALGIDRDGLVIPFTDISQGDNDGNRTGNSIFVRRVQFNFQALCKVNDLQSLRVIIFKDGQQAGDTAPTPSMLLDAVGTRYAVQSGLNNETVGRFTILANRIIQFSPNRPAVTYRLGVPMRHHVRYNGSQTTDIQKGGLYVLLITNADPTVTNDQIDVNYWMRISYHDN